MASYLSSLGYYTIAMHPYRAAGWDRNLVYPKLGFDEMHFQEFSQILPLCANMSVTRATMKRS